MFVIKINSKHNLKWLMITDTMMYFGNSVLLRQVRTKVIMFDSENYKAVFTKTQGDSTTSSKGKSMETTPPLNDS
jgi:hypothetical protein